MTPAWSIGGTVVVTGAGRGLGRAIAMSLGERGARVVIADIDRESAFQVADELDRAGATARAGQVDVADKDSVDALARMAAADGDLVGWVNNAGVNALAHIDDIDVDSFMRLVSVNLVGCLLGTQAAAGAFEGPGAIVNMSSISAHVALKANAHYAATKGGIEAFSRHAALDLASRGIRVNCVAPGTVLTPMTEHRYKDRDAIAVREADIPLGRLAAPGDISGPVAFLCSPESSYMTGQTVVVDGGWTIAA